MREIGVLALHAMLHVHQKSIRPRTHNARAPNAPPALHALLRAHGVHPCAHTTHHPPPPRSLVGARPGNAPEAPARAVVEAVGAHGAVLGEQRGVGRLREVAKGGGVSSGSGRAQAVLNKGVGRLRGVWSVEFRQ